MIVVSDTTSPILNPVRIGRLELLRSLYAQGLIPPAVQIDLPSTGWLIIAPLRAQDRVETLRKNLDPGEAEASALALERQADLLLLDVLLDERRARRIASALGLRVTGLLGVLAEAKWAGLIERAKPDLYAHVLGELGER